MSDSSESASCEGSLTSGGGEGGSLMSSGRHGHVVLSFISGMEVEQRSQSGVVVSAHLWCWGRD